MSTEVKILGKTYAVRSGFDESFTSETADLVNSRMRELVGKAGSLSSEKIAVLTAMNLAGELLQERRELSKVRQGLKAKAEKILELVESHL